MQATFASSTRSESFGGADAEIRERGVGGAVEVVAVAGEAVDGLLGPPAPPVDHESGGRGSGRRTTVAA